MLCIFITIMHNLVLKKLNELGLNDIAEIIRYHHEKVDCKACGELQILCLADSLN